MTETLSRDGAQLRLGPLTLVNNTWGRGELKNGVDFTQTVRWGDGALRFDWAWPTAHEGVRAYPELIVGRKPWDRGLPDGPPPMPLALTEGLTLRVALDWGGDPGFNAALDLWIAPGPRAGPEAVTQEVMVWLKAGALRPAGRPAAHVEAGDCAGPLHVAPGHGAGWTYIALVCEAELREGVVDLGALLARLRAEGLVEEDGWLLSVEFGAEVAWGAGWMEVRDFALSHPGHAEIVLPPPCADFC